VITLQGGRTYQENKRNVSHRQEWPGMVIAKVISAGFSHVCRITTKYTQDYCAIGERVPPCVIYGNAYRLYQGTQSGIRRLRGII
jgi:hypothetical protein